MRKPETKITQSIIEYIKRTGGDAHHVHGTVLQRGGEPDIDGSISIAGSYVHLKIEVKTSNGELEPRQMYRLRTYNRMGYLTGVVRSLDEFIALVEEYRDWESRRLHASYIGIHNIGYFRPTKTDYPEIYEW